MTTKIRLRPAALIGADFGESSAARSSWSSTSEAYWLEDVSGARLSEESTRTSAPFARALDLYRAGRDPDTMLVVARLETGERYELEGGATPSTGRGIGGIPARPRTPLPPEAG